MNKAVVVVLVIIIIHTEPLFPKRIEFLVRRAAGPVVPGQALVDADVA